MAEALAGGLTFAEFFALLVFVATVAAFAGDGSVWGRSAIRGTVTVTVTILVSVTVLTLVVWLFEAVGMATGTA